MSDTPLHPAPVCHVVGGGVAGLAAAVDLAARGVSVHLYESSSRLGGRCRSFPDPRFGSVIDNGSHLAFSANVRLLDFLRRIGAPVTSLAVAAEGIPFLDIAGGVRWTLVPRGETAAWLLGRGARIPGAPRWHWLFDGLALLRARDGETVSQLLRTDTMAWRRLWHPFCRAVFNAEPAEVPARRAGELLRRLVFSDKGCLPLLALRPWGEIVAEPALAHLQYLGVNVGTSMPLLALERKGEAVRRLIFRTGTIDTEGDAVVFALPGRMARRLCPDFIPELAFNPIIALHFDVGRDLGCGFIGVVGGLAEWIFRRGPIVSVTVGCATPYLGDPHEDLALAVWGDVLAALPEARLPDDPPPFRLIIEKGATLAADAATWAARPGTATPLANLFLAGDWTATGLPSTLEGAVISGESAASAVRNFLESQ